MTTIIDEGDLAINNARRVPTVLCLDTSSSMVHGNKLELLNKALVDFYNELRRDSLTKYAIDISIVTFNTTVTKTPSFQSIRKGDIPQVSNPTGLTHLAEAIDTGITALEDIKARYKAKGIGYFQPWLVILSDGNSEGEEDDFIERVAQRSRAAEKNNKLTIIPAFIGNPSDEVLAAFSKYSAVNKPQSFDASKLTTFARWLSESLSTVAHSDASNEPHISFSTFEDYLFSESVIS